MSNLDGKQQLFFDISTMHKSGASECKQFWRASTKRSPFGLFPFVSDKAKFMRAHWPIGSDVPSPNTPIVAIPVVEIQGRNTKLERLLAKNQL